MNNKPTYLSRDGLEKLQRELEDLISVSRPDIAQRIHDAKEHGDDMENADCVVLIGGNPASNHPRMMRTLLTVRRRGGKVIVVNSVRIIRGW